MRHLLALGETMLAQQHTVAVFIDADNVGAEKADKALTAVRNAGMRFQTIKAYGNFSTKPKSWRAFSQQWGVNHSHWYSIAQGKNTADIALAVHATEHICSDMFSAADAVMIISSDSDYLPLVQLAKSKGLEVIGVGESHAPEAYKVSCTTWIDLDSSIESKEVA